MNRIPFITQPKQDSLLGRAEGESATGHATSRSTPDVHRPGRPGADRTVHGRVVRLRSTLSAFWVVSVILVGAPQTGCGGFFRLGAITNLRDDYASGECAAVVRQVSEYSSWLEGDSAALAEAYFLKANCLDRMSREAEAQQLYHYVVDQHPDTPFAYQARALIEEPVPESRSDVIE
jgi:hypothetical protein